MTYLLQHTFMFLPLPKNCYMQITGPSLWLSGSGSMMEEGSELQQQELWSRKDRYFTLPSYTSRAHRRRRRKEIFELLSAHSKAGLRRPHKRRKLEEEEGEQRMRRFTTATEEASLKREEKNEGEGKKEKSNDEKNGEEKRRGEEGEEGEMSLLEEKQEKIRKHRKHVRRKKKEKKRQAKAEEEERRKASSADKPARGKGEQVQNDTNETEKKPRLSMWRRRKEKRAAARSGGTKDREGTKGEEIVGSVEATRASMDSLRFTCDSDDPMSESDEASDVEDNNKLDSHGKKTNEKEKEKKKDGTVKRRNRRKKKRQQGKKGGTKIASGHAVSREETNGSQGVAVPDQRGTAGNPMWLNDPLLGDRWKQTEMEELEREASHDATKPLPSLEDTAAASEVGPSLDVHQQSIVTITGARTVDQLQRETKSDPKKLKGTIGTKGTKGRRTGKTKKTKTKKKKMSCPKQKPASVAEPYVPRSRIFYANPASVYFGLPPRHTLNRIKCTKMGARRLLREMFVDSSTYDSAAPLPSKPSLRRSDSGLLQKPKKVKSVRLPRSLQGLVPLAMHIIRRNEKTKKTKTYSRALHRYCPIPTTTSSSKKPAQPCPSATTTGPAEPIAFAAKKEPPDVCDMLFTQEGQRTNIMMDDDVPASQLDVTWDTQDFNRSLVDEQLPKGEEDPQMQTNKPKKGAKRVSEAIAQLKQITSYSTLFSTYCCTYRQVSSFVKAVLAYLLPSSLWGSKHNVGLLAKSVDEFVRLRRFDRYSIYSVMSGLKLRDMAWLRNTRRPYKDRQLMVQRLISWVYAQIVVPLLRIHFYVTESGQYGKRIFYYRKPVWAHIYRLAMNECRRSQVFTEVPSEEAKEALVAKERQLGFSFIRFLPKSGGVRPIVNLKRKPTEYAALSVLRYKGAAEYMKDKMNKKLEWSINTILKSTFHIMNHAKNNNPEVLGASVFSYNDVYVRLSTFINELRQQRKTKRLPRLYFVSMDIKSCFNNINQEKCFEVVDRLLPDKEDYLVYRVNTHIPVPTLRRIVSRAEGRVMRMDELPQAHAFAKELATHLRNSVITDQVVHIHMDKQETMELLKQHLFDNLVVDRMDGSPTFYRQTKGIAQGSVLSSLLCSLVYGDLENSRFKHLPWDSRSLPTFYTPSGSATQTILATPADDPSTPKGVLVRLIDDFLYITTSAEMAKRFVLDMHKGYPSHGCTVNTLKTQLNFDMAVEGKKLTNVNRRSTGSVLSWCGLLINTRTLQITADYTRYAGTYIAEQLTTGGGGRKLWAGMLNAAKPKCHALLLDSRINRPEGVALNVYQSFMLSAIKFYCQVKAMPRGANKNPGFFLGVIFDVIRYMWMLSKSRTSCGIAKQMDCRFPLSRQEVMWLGYKAFATVLKAKQTDFSLLLPPLCAKARSIWRNLRHQKAKQRLAYAASPKNSEVFKFIRY